MIQLILIIDFAHSWAENWVEQLEETGSKWYYGGEDQLLKQRIEQLLSLTKILLV